MARPSGYSLKALSHHVRTLPKETVHRYKKLSKQSKTTIWVITAIHIVVLIAVIIVTPTRIGQWFNAFSGKVKSMGVGGMFLCGLLVALSSHPPLFGFMGSMTLIGFTYGVWPGFLIATLACLLGAGLSFLSIRMFFMNWIRKRSNDQWRAFGHIMSAKGLPLVIMIRYCPIPWAIGNGLFASVEGVTFAQFMIANLVMLPRLLIPVFIGSRLSSLTGETPTHDPLQFWLNLGSIALSASISVGTGYWIYKLTLEQMRKSGNGPDGEIAAEALEEGALLGDFSDDDDETEDEPLTVRGDALRPGYGGVIRRSLSAGSG